MCRVKILEHYIHSSLFGTFVYLIHGTAVVYNIHANDIRIDDGPPDPRRLRPAGSGRDVTPGKPTISELNGAAFVGRKD